MALSRKVKSISPKSFKRQDGGLVQYGGGGAVDMLGGFASGAASGAAAGAVFGPWGAVIGGVAGGAIGVLGANKEAQEQNNIKKQGLLQTSGISQSMINNPYAQIFAYGGEVGDPDYTGMGISFMNNKKIYKRSDFNGNFLTKLRFRHPESIAHGDYARYYAGIPLTGRGSGRMMDEGPQTYDLQYSQYKPSNAKNPNSKYVSNQDPKFKKQVIQYYNENYNGKPLRPSYTSNPKKKGDYKTYSTFGDLGNFKIDSGEDKKGKYISYYDVWNYGRNDNPDINKKEFLGAVKPYEVYDRIYINDNKESKKYGGIIPGMQPNVEVEGGEVLQGKNGSLAKVIGPKHSKGGVKLFMENGGRVFSDKLIDPLTGKTFAEGAKRYM